MIKEIWISWWCFATVQAITTRWLVDSITRITRTSPLIQCPVNHFWFFSLKMYNDFSGNFRIFNQKSWWTNLSFCFQKETISKFFSLCNDDLTMLYMTNIHINIFKLSKLSQMSFGVHKVRSVSGFLKFVSNSGPGMRRPSDFDKSNGKKPYSTGLLCFWYSNVIVGDYVILLWVILIISNARIKPNSYSYKSKLMKLGGPT